MVEPQFDPELGIINRRKPTHHEIWQHKLYLKQREKRLVIWGLVHEQTLAGAQEALKNTSTKNLGRVIEVVERHNLLIQAYQDAKLNRLKDMCATRGHNLAPTDLEWDGWHAHSCVCLDCGADLGWYCPESPGPKKPYCVYTGDSDRCDHCGMPEERK